VEIVVVAVKPSAAAIPDAAAKPVSQIVSLDYRLLLNGPAEVNPDVGLVARITVRVLSHDRQRLFYTATWTYRGERLPFVRMGLGNGAARWQQMNSAAAVLSEAILYDLYVNRKPRKVTDGCMDFSDLANASSQPRS
jgi:hypothetical protein